MNGICQPCRRAGHTCRATEIDADTGEEMCAACDGGEKCRVVLELARMAQTPQAVRDSEGAPEIQPAPPAQSWRDESAAKKRAAGLDGSPQPERRQGGRVPIGAIPAAAHPWRKYESVNGAPNHKKESGMEAANDHVVRLCANPDCKARLRSDNKNNICTKCKPKGFKVEPAAGIVASTTRGRLEQANGGPLKEAPKVRPAVGDRRLEKYCSVDPCGMKLGPNNKSGRCTKHNYVPKSARSAVPAKPRKTAKVAKKKPAKHVLARRPQTMAEAHSILVADRRQRVMLAAAKIREKADQALAELDTPVPTVQIRVTEAALDSFWHARSLEEKGQFVEKALAAHA